MTTHTAGQTGTKRLRPAGGQLPADQRANRRQAFCPSSPCDIAQMTCFALTRNGRGAFQLRPLKHGWGRSLIPARMLALNGRALANLLELLRNELREKKGFAGDLERRRPL
jgi:hypothetical protein